ncbi:SPOR domain-containing protein [Tepidicaulis sp.]|uniref:SPOR domain-containing protein n=1 Tax=Tepidicaulis sp. TaxID=1920809 RepID=UPI003B5BFC3C
MTKKPASLTSELLAKKGEALPSSIDPQARASSPEEMSGAGASEEPAHASPSSVLLAEGGEEAPVRPEPDVVMEPDDEPAKREVTRRFIFGALVAGAVLVIAGIAMSLFANRESLAPSGGETVAETASPEGGAEETATAEDSGVETSGQAGMDQVVMDEGRGTAPVEEETGTAAETAESTEPAGETAGEPAPVEITPITPDALDLAEQGPELPAAPEEPVAEAEAPAASETAEPETAAAEETAPAAPQSNIAQSGQYLIQLLSVKDEAGARGAWAKLQGKYPALLGGEALNLQQADLGERGIYYRVRTGAFDSKAGANALCGKLKAAGQDCIVRRQP